MAAGASGLVHGRLGPVLARVLILHMELRLALVGGKGRQHDVDVAADELRVRVRVAHALQVEHGLLHHLESDLGVGHLASAELEPQLHLVAVVQELLGVAKLREKVVLCCARRELDLA